jgi:hypothetical protein
LIVYVSENNFILKKKVVTSSPCKVYLLCLRRQFTIHHMLKMGTQTDNPFVLVDNNMPEIPDFSQPSAARDPCG